MSHVYDPNSLFRNSDSIISEHWQYILREFHAHVYSPAYILTSNSAAGGILDQGISYASTPLTFGNMDVVLDLIIFKRI